MKTKDKNKEIDLDITRDIKEISKELLSKLDDITQNTDFKNWTSKTNEILKQIYFMKHLTTIEQKQQQLEKLENEIENNMTFIEYIITSTDIEVVNNSSNYNLLRHDFYSIKNQILDIKNDITSEKIDRYYIDFEKADNKLSELEGKFEGLGATVITIILSITIISSSIVAIERIQSTLIPLFIVGMVWLGMTFLTFTNFLFRKKDTEIWIALIFYIVFSLIFILTLFITLRIIVV